MPTKLFLEFPATKLKSCEVLPEEAFMVGRKDRSNLKVDSYFKGLYKSFEKVSREHFQIYCERIDKNTCHFVITDLDSTNGTWLNGYRLVKNRPFLLSNSDKIELPVSHDDKLLINVSLIVGDTRTDPIVPSPPPLLKPIIEQISQFNDVLLLGLPGAGKTTLLQKKLMPSSGMQDNYHQKWPDYRFLLFCYVNCQELKKEPSLIDFFRLLINRTKPGFSKNWPAEIRHQYDFLATSNCSTFDIKEAMFKTIEAVNQHLGKRIVFLFDQFDDIKLPPEAFAILKDIKWARGVGLGDPQKPNIIYIFAMSNEFPANIDQIHQFLRTKPSLYWLPAYKNEDLENLFAKEDALDADKVKISIEFGGKQPRLTELVHEVVREMSTTSNDENLLILELLKNSRIVDHCQKMWDSLLPVEQEVLKSVANGTPTMMMDMQKRLTNKSLLIDEGDNLIWVSPLFGDYVKSVTSPPEVSPSLPPATPTNLGIRIDEATSEFIVDSRRIPAGYLTRLEEGLLRYLLVNAGRVCSIFEIWENVWGHDRESKGFENAIARVIHTLRKKLNQISEGSERYIFTIGSRRGYKYVTQQPS